MSKMILHLFFLFLFQFRIEHISAETVSGCTINNNHNHHSNNNNNNNRRITQEKTSVTLSCANNGYILVRNLTFGVHKNSLSSTPTCSYQPGDCTTRTTYIGMECNGLTTCDLDLNPQYLHICSQYSDYMVLEYSCLQGPSLSVCENRLLTNERRVFLRSPNYPHEYENSLNCSCQISNHGSQSQIKFLDFYLEERDEMNFCSRDQLQIANRSYCGSTIDENQQISSIIPLISSFHVSFKTNDVITRKGFWLMIDSEQPLQISCNHLMESSSTISTATTTTTTVMATIVHHPTTSLIPLTTDSTRSNQKRRHTLSYILILTIVFVVVLLLLNLLLIVLCWRQRRPKKSLDTKTNRPFICSSTSSSSSITYGGTPMLTSIDAQKQQTLSSRYVLQSNQSHMDSTPSTSTTTATGPYEDLNDSMTLQRHCHHEKSPDNHSLYTQNRPTISTPNMAYNRMIHFPPRPIRCHFSIPAQTFYPPQPLFDSQHIYETIQDGHCPYQRLAATLRRQQHKQQQAQPQCTCYYEHSEQQTYPARTHEDVNSTVDLNPETLV